MPNTPLLGITQVAANQNSKEVTINDAILALEGAIAAVKTISYASITDYTLTAAETTRNMVFKVTNAATNIVLRFPNSIAGNPTDRTVVIMNKSGRQLTVRTATGSGSVVVIPNAASRLISIVNGSDVEVAAQPSTLVNFVDLADGPGSYAGKAGKVIAVNQAENKLDFVDVVAFPAYAGNAGKVLVVNGSATGVQWADYATNFLALTDTPNNYAGNAGKAVMVNEAGTGLAFVDLPEVEAVEFLPAKRWRVRTLALDPSADKAAWGEIEFLNADGVDLTGLSGGTSTASSFSSGKEALYAFDNNLTAGNGWMSDTTDATTSWVEYEFAVSQVVRKVRLTPIDQLAQYTPTEFIVERYNGTEWVSAGQRQPNAWESGVSQTFVIAGTPLESVTEAPADNNYYARRNEQWVEILEVVRDTIAGMISSTPDSHISLTHDDNANKLWIAVNGEFGINEQEFEDLLAEKVTQGDNIIVAEQPDGSLMISVDPAMSTSETYRGDWTAVPGDLNFDGALFPEILEDALIEGWVVVDYPDSTGGYTKALRNKDIGNFEGTGFSFDVLAAPGDNGFQIRLAMDYENSDGFSIQVDGVTVLSGSPATHGVDRGEFIELAQVLSTGPHTISINYGKDSSGSVGTDSLYISNIVIPSAGIGGYRYSDVVDFEDGRYFCLNSGTTEDPSNGADWQALGNAGGGLPTGGVAGQIIGKLGPVNGDVGWIDDTTELAELDDVDMTGIENGQMLVWDSVTEKMVPIDAPNAVGTAEGPSGPALGAVKHKSWRLYVTATYGNPSVQLAELQFRSLPGVDQLVGPGTAFHNSQLDGSIGANVFDNNPVTIWHTAGTIPGIVGYHFVDELEVNEVKLTLRNGNGLGGGPKDFRVEYSDDNGATWQIAWSVAGAGFTAEGETRVFTNPAAGAVVQFYPTHAAALNDVDMTGITNGAGLVWDASEGKFIPGSATGIEDAPADGLLYARRDNSWEYFEPGSGGGGGGGVGGLPMLFDLSKGVPTLAQTDQLGDTSGRFTWTQNAGRGLNVKYNGPDSGTPDLAGFGIDKPEGDFHVAIFSIINSKIGRYTGRILGIRESSSGKIRTFAQFTGAHYVQAMMSYSNFTTRVANSESGQFYGDFSGPLWQHVRLVGSTLSFGWSRDGANPCWEYSEAVTTYCPTFDQIIFGGFFEHTDNPIGTNVTFLCVDEDADARLMGTDNPGVVSNLSPFWKEPPTRPQSADFTLFKDAATVASLEDTTRGFLVTCASHASVDKNTMVEVPIDNAGPWSVEFFVSHAAYLQRHLTLGMAVRDATTNRVHFLGFGCGDDSIARSREIRWNSISSYNGDINPSGNGTGQGLYSPTWLRLVNDGVNLTLYTSTDQEAWMPIRQAAKNAWCANIDTVGLWFACLNLQGMVANRQIHVMGFKQS